MKKLFLILTLLFLTFSVKAQFPITQNLGGPTTLVRVPANGGLQGSLINRNFTDTTAANLTAIDYYAGAQIFTTSDGKFWVRNAAATEWIDISAGGNAGDLVPFYGCVSGCTVTWLQDYDYEVVASVYYINGVRYESGTDTVTLDPSDPTNDRIDVFVLDTSGAADKVTGTAAATPIEPDVDALTQLRISFALVENNTTEPTIGNVWIYRENDGPPTEWTTATVSGTINLASTNFPYAGTKDIEATNMPALASFTATSSTSVSWGSYDALVFKIRSKGNWTTNRPLQIYLYNSTLGLKTPPVILNTGQYGFNSSTTGVYQNVTIPLADFGNIVNMNAIQFARTSGSGTIGWYIDDIQLTTINFNPPASSGTVTSFAAGNLSPLFTTTVTNPTSTPTLSFTLSNAGAYTYFGNNTGTSAAPTYTSIRSLSASSALTDSLLVSSGGQLKLLAQSAVVPITNNVSVLNDSTILVCNYLNVCDTFEISTVTAQYVYIVNDSTLLVCASDNSTCDTLNIPQTFFDRGFFSPNQASFGTTFHNAYNNDFIVVAMDTFSTDADHYLMALDGLPFSTATSLRYLAIDTLTSKLYRTSGGGLVTADNGLTANTATNVRLGGTLVENTTITTSGSFILNVAGTRNGSAELFNVTNSGTGYAAYFLNSSNTNASIAIQNTLAGPAILAMSDNGGRVLNGIVSDGNANTVLEAIQISRATTTTASAGIGSSVTFVTENGGGGTVTANTLTSTLTTVTALSEVSQFAISGINAGSQRTLLTIGGSGLVTLGVAGTQGGTLALTGTTSGTVTIQTQAAAGTFNFNLPTTAGTSGYLLTSGGGGASAMTWTDPSTIVGVNIYNSDGTTTAARTVTLGNNTITWNGTQASSSNYAFNVANSGNGGGVGASTTGLGNAVAGSATTGTGVSGSATSGTGLVGTGTTGFAATFRTTIAGTNTESRIVQFTKGTNGTAASGMGGYLILALEDDGSSDQEAVRLGAIWTDAAAATRTADFKVSTVLSGSMSEKFRVTGNGRSIFTGRILPTQGADVASVAGAIAVGLDGNVFELTGTNAVTLISNLNWQNGSEITFVFTSTATLTDGTANSGTDIGMELAGNTNFVGSADDVITLVLTEMGGTQRWREKSRSVN